MNTIVPAPPTVASVASANPGRPPVNAPQSKPRRYRHGFKRLLAECEVEVAAPLREGTSPGRIYHKRCFSRAFDYAGHHRAAGPVLCHGMLLGGSGWYFLHAWVEMSGDVVFDGVVQMFCSREGYYRCMGVDPERVWRYSPDEVVRLSMETLHTGPWHVEG